MTSEEARQRLIALLLERSVRTGHFELASGAFSDLYIDARQTTLHGAGAALVGRLVLEALRDEVVGVGGPTLGADPVVCSAVALSGSILGRVIHGFLIRKEPKGHGTGRFVEGLSSLPRGSRVCVVEDTTTTGGSLLRGIERARGVGLDVVQCLTVVDRGEGAAARLEAEGLQLQALVHRHELQPGDRSTG